MGNTIVLYHVVMVVAFVSINVAAMLVVGVVRSRPAVVEASGVWDGRFSSYRGCWCFLKFLLWGKVREREVTLGRLLWVVRGLTLATLAFDLLVRFGLGVPVWG